MNRISRIALGTVQFGLPYGVANPSGQVTYGEAAAILDYGRVAGLDTLDTAIAYGDSEQRLGKIGVGQWQVISKLPALSETCMDVAAWVQESVRGSLERLRIPKLHGLLLHQPLQLLGAQGGALYRALAELKNQGAVEKIGVSIYNPDELNSLCPRYQFDLVQAPFNVIDQRLMTSGWLRRLNQAGTEVHVRSIFLQGLLLMGATNRPAAFSRWQSLWVEWHRWLDSHSMTPLQACLGFAMSQPEINRVVVGVDSLEHLQGLLSSADALAIVPPVTLRSEDLDLINPSRWSEH